MSVAELESLTNRVGHSLSQRVIKPGDAFAIVIYLIAAVLLLLQMLMRLALIDVLLVVAPLGLLCWVLPQTQGWADRWVSTFTRTVFTQVPQIVALKLGASLITLPLWSTTSARAILGLPLSVHPCCIVPLGWPRGRYGPTTRKPVGDVVHLDRFGNQPWRSAVLSSG